jgi:hypothetical protein
LTELNNESNGQNIPKSNISIDLIDHASSEYAFSFESNSDIYLESGTAYEVTTTNQFADAGAKQHHDWNNVDSEYKLNHDFTASSQVVEQTAYFEPLDSVIITSDHEISLSIKDPWYVSGGEQNNDFYTLSDTTYEAFLAQDPDDEEEFYAIKTVQFIGTDSLGFNRWQAYHSNYLVDTSQEWAELATPNNFDSCMVIFKQEHVKVKPLYVDVSGAPSTPTNFSVDTSGDHPVLSWSANSEKDLDHYKIRVRYWTRFDPGIGWHNKGTTSDTTYTDTNVDPPGGGLPDYIAYKISAIDAFDNASTETDSIKISGDVITWPMRENDNHAYEENEIPDQFVINNAYPNPFNPQVSIPIGLPEDTFLKIMIYNSLGQKIDDINSGLYTSGYHTIIWNGSDFPTGVYLIVIDSEKIHETQKVILIK